MGVHIDNLTILLLWSVCCLLVMRAPMEVRGDALTPETCTQTSTPCPALVAYVPSVNLALSRIASLFSLNYTDLLGPNDIDPSLQDLSTLVVPEGNVYIIPQTCGCVGNKRTVTSTNYTVVSGDTLSTIADAYYSRLVTYQEIAEVNDVANPDLIDVGQEFTIPIPCACFSQSNGTQPAEFLSYQIQTGDSLTKIATKYNTSSALLKQFNSLNNESLPAADVLFVPRPVCKANFLSGAEDGNLTVVEGTYELTANDCVQCSCNNGTLHCIQAPSSLGATCSNLTCQSSSLALGASNSSQGQQGCSVQSCVYKGYNKSGIVTRLETEEDSTCPSALPPETFYKPPLGLVAAPLGLPTPTTPSTPSTPPPSGTTTPGATAPSSTPNSATRLVGFFSWWWCLPAAVGLLL